MKKQISFLFMYVIAVASFSNASSVENSLICAKECDDRSSLGTIRLKGPKEVSEKAANLWMNNHKANIKACRVACENETTPEGCKKCAEKTITAEKLEQDRTQLVPFECPKTVEQSTCVDQLQPKFVFNYTPTPGKCFAACSKRNPFSGKSFGNASQSDQKTGTPSELVAQAWLGNDIVNLQKEKNSTGFAFNWDATKKIFTIQVPPESTPIELLKDGAFTNCLKACYWTTAAECGKCAEENITDAKQKEMIDLVEQSYPPCDAEIEKKHGCTSLH